MKKDLKHIGEDMKNVGKEIGENLLGIWNSAKNVVVDFWEHDKHPDRFNRWLSRINTSLVFLISIMVLIAFIMWIGDTVRQAGEEFIENRLIDRLVSTQREISGNGSSGQSIGAPPDIEEVNGKVITSSFTDIFSGFGSINGDETTMYHDRITTAFSFPPNFDWNRADILTLNANNFITRDEEDADRRCLGSFCLVQKNLELYMAPRTQADYEQEQYRIDLPETVQDQNLVNISIGNLNTRWLVGAVEQVGGEYVGRVYYFNGESFETVFDDNTPFESRYRGTIGFGGSDDNFLVVYGAYEGQAYHVRPEEGITDISQFFGIRIMDDGFQPVVIQGGEDENSVWYVYSLTSGTPKLVKLFQNGTEDIVGVVDLSRLLFAGGTDLASFYLDPDSGNLNAEIQDGSGEPEYWEFVDRGFDKMNDLRIESVNINNYPAEIKSAAIENIDFSGVGAEVQFYLSNDGEEWHPVNPGENVSFPNDQGGRLMWRAEFTPNDNPETSPFLDLIRLDYRVEF